MTSQDTSLQASTRTTFYGISARLFAQLETLIQILHKSQVPMAGYDVLLARQRAEQLLSCQPDLRGKLQQEQIERFAAQELLVSHMTQQLSTYSQGLEQLHSICLKQEQRVSCIENHAAELERQVGQKAKRITDLEVDDVSKTSQLQGLELQVQKYKKICSYVTHMVTNQIDTAISTGTCSPAATKQDLLLHRANCEQQVQQLVNHVLMQEADRHEELRSMCLPNVAEATASAKVSASSPNSPPNAAATKSSSDTMTLMHLNHQQSSDESSMGPKPVVSDSLAMQELTGTPWLKRMPCLIIARHPQTPREVTVVCKQISGTLLLQDVRQELRIRSHTEGNPVLSPADFEAAAGCSKGKNWKANIRVQGKNGCTQMLKIWLPGLVQLVGDHSKTAIAKSSPISALLDEESGLRIQIPVLPS